MKLQRPPTDLVVTPAQVWSELTAAAQAGVIQLMARLASNLVAQLLDSTHPEISPCLHDSVPPRSAPTIWTAQP
jgi:hypothetical protein